jgi:L-threonylcarbamoyladenylate synthase
MIIGIGEYERALDAALAALKAGKLIVYPTDTLYGLGADATSEEAVGLVREAKGRDDRPISIMCSGLGMIEEYCDVRPEQRGLLAAMFPGPFTAVLPVRKGLPENLTLGKTVGVRVPHYFFLTGLVKEFGKPMTGTSANLTGGKSPCSLQEVPGEVLEKAEVAIDGGKCLHSAPSTVVDLTGKAPKVLRQGAGKLPDGESDFDASFF